MELEFIQFSEVLKAKEAEDNWESKDKALNSLREMVQGGSCRNDDFVNRLRSIYEDLLFSLRTQLVLSSCNFIKVLAKEMGKGFEVFLDATFPGLMKICAQVKKINVAAASECMLKIIEATRSSRILSSLTNTMGDKNTGLRAKTGEFTLAIVKVLDVATIIRMSDLIERFVLRWIADASPEVRSFAKEIFWVYQDVCAEKAENLLEKLEPKSQKVLKQTLNSTKSLSKLTRSRKTLSSTLVALEKDVAPNAPSTATNTSAPAATTINSIDEEENASIVLTNPIFKQNIEALRQRDSSVRLDALKYLTLNCKKMSTVLINRKMSEGQSKALTSLVAGLIPIFSDAHFLVIQCLMDVLNLLAEFLCLNYDLIPSAEDHLCKIFAPTLNIMYEPKYETVPGIVDTARLIATLIRTKRTPLQLLSLVTGILGSSPWARRYFVKKALLDLYEEQPLDSRITFFKNKNPYRVWVNKMVPAITDSSPELREQVTRVVTFLCDQNPKDFVQLTSQLEGNFQSLLQSLFHNEIVVEEKPVEIVPIKQEDEIEDEIIEEQQVSIASELAEKLQSGEIDGNILARLIKISKDNDASIWTRGFTRNAAKWIFRFLDFESTQVSVRENLLILLKQLILNQTEVINGIETDFLRRILSYRSNERIEFCTLADECMEAFIQVVPKPVLMLCFYSIFPKPNAPNPTVAFYYLANVAHMYPADAMENELPKLVPYLVNGLSSSFVETRKSVIDCLVQIHQVIHDTLFSYLEDLTLPQLCNQECFCVIYCNPPKNLYMDKDTIIFSTKKPLQVSNDNLSNDTSSNDNMTDAVDQKTGEINWDCPCLAGALEPPCGQFFKAAFSCFVQSTSEPKGEDCVEKFMAMQNCYKEHPEIYFKEDNNNDV